MCYPLVGPGSNSTMLDGLLGLGSGSGWRAIAGVLKTCSAQTLALH
jgi:hypothetical protein